MYDETIPNSQSIIRETAKRYDFELFLLPKVQGWFFHLKLLYNCNILQRSLFNIIAFKKGALDMKYNLIFFIIILFYKLVFSEELKHQIDFETGYVWQTKNSFQIPNNSTATRKDRSDFDKGPYQVFRAYYSYKVSGLHSIRLLIAPFVIQQDETLSDDFLFQNKLFTKGDFVTFTYKFNSYRLSYLYTFIHSQNFSWHLGFTGKIRDAMIQVKDKNQESSKKNIGVVPLISFGLKYRPSLLNSFEFELDGDALAAPQGRAEDVSLKITYLPNSNSRIYIGYRLLEGGADNKGVYTFSLFNYVIAGLKVLF